MQHQVFSEISFEQVRSLAAFTGLAARLPQISAADSGLTLDFVAGRLDSINDAKLHALLKQASELDIPVNMRIGLGDVRKMGFFLNTLVEHGLLNELLLSLGDEELSDKALKPITAVPDLFACLRVELDIDDSDPAILERVSLLSRILLTSKSDFDPFDAGQIERTHAWQSMLLWACTHRNVLFDQASFERLQPQRMSRLMKPHNGRVRSFLVMRTTG